jgi:hypothetical protein
MKKFGLFTKLSPESINQVEAGSKAQAISFFAKIKSLKKEDLLKIFDIKELEATQGGN